MRINPDHIQEVISLYNRTPYLEKLGIRLVKLESGRSLLKVRVTQSLCNMFGGIHGGLIATLVDCATYTSIYCSVPEDMGYVTIDVTVSDLRSVHDGTLHAEGRLIKAGRSLCTAEAFIRDDEGRLVGHGTSKCMVGATLQPMSVAVENLGEKSLPPKFLD